tara:strand:+ start:170 stop:541 length:372 start_codon:yes stop_codon:yes gene_type:complete
MGTWRNSAQYEKKVAYLSSDFGYDLAVKWFGQEEVETLPKYTKGKHEGKPMGFVLWVKCVKGGYHPFYYKSSGQIETRKGWIIGKALYQTDWTYNFQTKKATPRNTIVKEFGEDSIEVLSSLV